jgi:succinoglycan biosynthesis transport protein ExoP
MSTTIGQSKNAVPVASGIAVTELWYIFRRQLRSILFLIAIGTTGAILLGLAQPEQYTAVALIMVQPRDSKIISVNSGVESLPIDAATLETHTRLLESRELALRVINDLHLTTDPEFRPAEPRSTWLVDALKAALALKGSGAEDHLVPAVISSSPPNTDQERPPSDTEADDARLAQLRDPALPAVLRTLEQSLHASVVGRSYVIAVSFSARAPTTAARIANAAAGQYITMLREQTRSAASEASSTFGERLKELRQAAQQALADVEKFKANNNIVTVTEGVDVNDQRLIELNNELLKATAEEQEKAARLSRLQKLRQHDGSLEAVAAVLDSKLIESIRQQQVQVAQLESEARKTYGSNHPRMLELREQSLDLNRKIEAEVERVMGDLRYRVEVARGQETSLREAIAQVTATKSAIAEASSQLASLQQQAEAARKIYDAFLQQTEETKQQAFLGEPQARIASRAALPDAPDRLPLKFFGFVGLIASTFGASLIAVFRHRMRGTVRRGRDLREHADLRCLGLIPRLDFRGFHEDGPVSAAGVDRSAFAECLRSVIIAIQHERVRRSCCILAVTSALPEEGKSFTAVSLSITLGRLGLRTLLIDLDLRRPSISRLLRQTSSGGLFEVVSGECDIDECILPQVSEGLDLLPARAMPADPVAILSAPNLHWVLEGISHDYDWVVIDCPPTLGLADARLVGQMAGMVMFVTRWDSTPISALKFAIGDLRSFGVNLVGGIINDVDLRQYQKLGYGFEDHEGYYLKYSPDYVET